MSFTPDPRNAGLRPFPGNAAPGGNFQQPTTSQFGAGRPEGDSSEDTVPLTQLVKSPSSQRLKRRVTWTVVSAVVLLCALLGFIFANSLRSGQPSAQGAHTPATKGQTVQPSQNGTPSLTPGSYTSINSRLFSNTSPWNAPIGTNVQLDPRSSGMVSLLSDCCHVPTLFSFGMPIYNSTASDPTYTVQDTGNDSTFESYQPIHIPNTAAPSTGSDHWLFIYDQTRNLIFEMWNTHKDGDTWTTQTGNVYSPTGDGVLQVDGSQQSGNGASYFGGVITHADIERGYINHALSFASQYTSTNWRYPMNASDGNGTDTDDLPMGARIQLDPSINCKALPGASTGEKMICQALETYGGYIRDSGGVTLSMYFEGEDLTDPDRSPPDGSPGNAGRTGGLLGNVGFQEHNDLSHVPWDKLRVLKSWNSYTAASATTAPGASALSTYPAALNSGISARESTLDLPVSTQFVRNDDASNRRELAGNRRSNAVQPVLSAGYSLLTQNSHLVTQHLNC